MNDTPEQTLHFPALPEGYDDLEAPVDKVTLLEDRAQVLRRGRLELPAGTHKLRLAAVAPVLQDVSLRAEVASGSARVTDSRARRALRVRREHKEDDVRALDATIEELQEQITRAVAGRERTENRLHVVRDMLLRGLSELPEDVAWGHATPELWRDSFGSLFERVRELHMALFDHYFEHVDLKRDLDRAVVRRRVMERPDRHVVAFVEVDVVVEEAGEVELEVFYVVPNALWRPIHSARLVDGVVHLESRAAVWQNTGEDWRDATLIFSTAQSSLGTDPPLLSDDELSAQRKDTTITVEARQVDVQSASVGGAPAPPPSGVELPGVDDGGDVQNIEAPARVTIPSDGRPNFIPLFSFEAEAAIERLAVPELDTRVFLRATLHNRGPRPILAGPVELIRDSEVVGWTKVLFVAPNEAFELAFGPEPELKVTRKTRRVSRKVDEVDKWTRQVTELKLYLSNLGEAPSSLTVKERIPVSEIEHVVVGILDKGTSDRPEVDDNGFCTFSCELEGHGRQMIKMRWEMKWAPDVGGL